MNHMENGIFAGLDAAVQNIIKLGIECEKMVEKPQIVDVDGVSYLYDRKECTLFEVKPELPDDAPTPESIEFFSLDGFADYVNVDPDGILANTDVKFIVHVVDPSTVCLLSKLSTSHKKRKVLAFCKAHAPKIVFGEHLDVETFNTMLLSTFVKTEALDTLFKVVASMTKEQNLSVADDGVSQAITVKQGISTTANIKFENPVPLKPIRTFTEVSQPESNFVLRVNDKACAALFEADGGAWKNEAVSNIGRYLAYRITRENVIVLA